MTDTIERLTHALADRYLIERELGAGGMATVYLAHDIRHDRKVALKVLRPELSAILGAERFLAEIKTTANLQHPHILSLFDSGTAAQGHGGTEFVYYVMPYVEGESLRDRLTREKQLPIEDAVRIAREVADALEYAHQRGVIHRDIKPENILLHGGHAQVADFGIALAVSRSDGGTRMTETGMSLGTPHYMSPEQAMGQREITPRADIYALGCVLYEMLVGEPPFMGPTAQAILARVMTEEPRSLTVQRHTIPSHLEAAVRTALEKLPADRFGSAAEFADSLQHIGFEAPTSGRRPARPGAPATWRHPVTLSLLAAVVVMSALAGWFAVRGAATIAAEPRYFELALPDSAPVAFAGPAPLGIWQRAVAVSPDGKTVAYVERKGEGTRLAVRHLDAGTAQELPGTEGAYFPFFSPDGMWIAFFVGGELRKVPAGGGTPSVITAGVVLPAGAAWVSQDSVLIAGLEGGKPFWVSPSGRPSSPIETHCGPLVGCVSVMDPQVLPGGEWAIGSSWGYVALVSLKGLGMRLLTAAGPVQPQDADPATVIRGWSPRYLESGFLIFLSGQGTELQAVAFDPHRLRIEGNVFRLLEGVRMELLYTGGQYALGDDGTFIYAAGADAASSVLAWVDASGRRDTLPFDPGAYGGLSLRSDGAVASLYRVNASGAVADLLILDLKAGRQLCSVPFARSRPGTVWNPDGSLWITPWDVFGTGGQAVERMSLDSCRPTRSPSTPLPPTASSPDGNWLAFTRINDSASLRSARDLSAPPVSIAPAGWNASFSPDSRWLAFTINRPTNKIMVIPVPYDGRRFQVASDEGDQPRWFPDGRRLAYKRGRQIMVVDLDFRDGGVKATPPRQFVAGPFPRVMGWAYDIGPDGRVLTFVNAEERSARQLNVITNFPEFVRRRAEQAAAK